jgi:predicted Zn-dependent protease
MDHGRAFREALPSDVEFASIRYVSERSRSLHVRNDVLEPAAVGHDTGAMVTVHHGGGLGYAATSDLSPSGLRNAFARAKKWAARTAGHAAFDPRSAPLPHPKGKWESPVATPLNTVPLADVIARLHEACAGMKVDDRVIERSASLASVEVESLYMTNGGGSVHQSATIMSPDLMVVAHHAGETQRRSFGLRGRSQQGGWEVMDNLGYDEAAERLAEEAVELVLAPDCPSGVMDLVIDPEQMMLQIHESIGHPLELDRILGDERNFAGTSFVTLDMFGSYQYGSEMLDVTFDPTVAGELAGYGWDDEGTKAERTYLIRRGLLECPLGGAISQARAGVRGVANARANGWARPPIDRMANLNIEPKDKTLDDLIRAVKRGIYVETNLSWSIDDSRNKFQFGCERGTLIENGKLTTVVKNPNYRGISANFWRSLGGVGNRQSMMVMGTPYCGKGEPAQVIRVGHASPPCLFRNVDVFGGAS